MEYDLLSKVFMGSIAGFKILEKRFLYYFDCVKQYLERFMPFLSILKLSICVCLGKLIKIKF